MDRSSSQGTLVRTRLVVVCAVGIVALVAAWSGAPGVVPPLLTMTALAAALLAAVSMVREMVHGRFGVDLLAVTAIVATVAVGEWLAAFVVVLMLVGGEALEAHAQRRATSALSRLLSDAPKTAHRSVDGAVVDVPVAEVAVGDVLVVRPYEVVPVDGLLVTDTATFDESRLTGESVPVGVSAGSSVPSGAVNGTAAVLLRADRTADASEYQQIVALVSGAMSSRSPMVRLADRYAPWFTAFAVVLGAVSW
ncbi:P-type ATPase [Curtobacterium sp. B18]|uniref:P-type ATPase n=1 Tax=Curtobacterium sp. B18 TaxID=95614 RepID=UPI0021C5C42B|nr:hypothetical protein [Curtobacterium sp. B18]